MYTAQELEQKPFSQLWDICIELKLRKYVNRAKCMKMILLAQEQQLRSKEEFTTREIDAFYHHEVYYNNKLIADIQYDEDYWQVLIDGKVIMRGRTFAQCYSYITIQYKRKTLPVHKEVQVPEVSKKVWVTELSKACFSFGFELWGDGIFEADFNLGKVEFYNNSWWAIGTKKESEPIACETVFNAIEELYKNASLRY